MASPTGCLDNNHFVYVARRWSLAEATKSMDGFDLVSKERVDSLFEQPAAAAGSRAALPRASEWSGGQTPWGSTPCGRTPTMDRPLCTAKPRVTTLPLVSGQVALLEPRPAGADEDVHRLGGRRESRKNMGGR